VIYYDNFDDYSSDFNAILLILSKSLNLLSLYIQFVVSAYGDDIPRITTQ
jgi:hypothetical protein